MENTIANIRILDVVRLVHGYFIVVFLVSGILLNTKGRIFFLKKNHREGV
jgi:hypothetical protein